MFNIVNASTEREKKKHKRVENQYQAIEYIQYTAPAFLSFPNEWVVRCGLEIRSALIKSTTTNDWNGTMMFDCCCAQFQNELYLYLKRIFFV